jgi:dsRNA-specific ribonuclease
MEIIRHYVKGPLAGHPAHPHGREVFCVHCAHSLGMQGSAVQQTKKEAGHLCAEKLLSREPASPPPYN